jgi:predicted kinase
MMETVDRENLFIVVIDGPMGAGKTTVSKLLNDNLEGTARLTLADVKRFISGFEKNHTYNKISQEIILVMVEEYLKGGISVIVEWAMKEERVSTLVAIANKYDARSYLFQLDAPKYLLLQRVKERTKDLLGMTELPEKNIPNIEENFEKNYSFHNENKYQNAMVLDSETLTPEEIVEQMLQKIK